MYYDSLWLRQQLLQDSNLPLFLLCQVHARRWLGVAVDFGGVGALFNSLLNHLDNGRRLLIRLHLGLFRVLQVRENTLA